jgi:Bacterial transglutaminase-like cysteine proteinase BTLCP
MENHARIISRNSIEPVDGELLLNHCSLIISPYFAKIRSLYLEPPQSQPGTGAGGEKNERLEPAIALALLASSLVGLGAAASASAAPAPAGVSYAPVGGPASVPYGWADFCRRYAGECGGGPLAPLDVNLTPQAMKEIERVDKWVNAHIKPVSDIEHWGVIDQWDYPADGKGDCED